ncbi:MAG: hypothetical protein ACI89D_000855 [Bermanella sp.]|jgi:hypothetical protein
MNKNLCACTLVSLTLLLAACTSNSLRDDETETFSARISLDGSKLFSYQLDTPSGGAPSARLVFDANENKDTNTAPEMKQYSVDDEKQRIELRVVKLLEQKLSVSAYCRDGYVLSQRTIGFSRSVLTGECRESASEQDRQQFGNSKH